MSEVIIAILSMFGGGLGQYIISSKLIPKREEREADKILIDTLMDRINILEGRIDQQTIVIKDLIKENAELKAELDYLKKDHDKK
jgi:hypothetical protein